MLNGVNCFTCSSNRPFHSDYSCLPSGGPINSRCYTHLLSTTLLLRSKCAVGDECVTENFVYINNNPSFINDNLHSDQKQQQQQSSDSLKSNCILR